MLAGFAALFFAPLVGIFVFSSFAAWFAILMVIRPERRERALTALWEKHDLKCGEIDESFAASCRPIEAENGRRMEEWREAKAARVAEYERAVREAEEEVRQRRAAWEASNAARSAEYARACGAIDAENRRMVEAWEAENRPWLEEEKRCRGRLARAESELSRLEAERIAHRSAVTSRFEGRKTEAERIVGRYETEKRGYDGEIRRAEADSKAIQLDEHLDRALIRSSKIGAMTPSRIMALESFGIETAKDLPMLRTRKVPGIGPITTFRLNAWRASVEKSCVYRSSLPESEKSRIAARFAPTLVPLADQIEAATRDLEGIIESHKAREADLLKAIGEAVQEVAVAEAHLQALDNLR